MGHATIRRGTVPVFHAWRAPDHIAFADFLDGAVFVTGATDAIGDHEMLPGRV
ncbi:MAG: hypothetical protein BWY57_03191 [Betaproteobacteria bacterium ADurb.Bin341]|nr:MAG: hypothetical protein BWY57_03191 [Betaproteobacteria bacterium ADurb.Bin341]